MRLPVKRQCISCSLGSTVMSDDMKDAAWSLLKLVNNDPGMGSDASESLHVANRGVDLSDVDNMCDLGAPAPAPGAGSPGAPVAPVEDSSDNSMHAAEMEAAARDTFQKLAEGWTSQDYLHNLPNKNSEKERLYLDVEACKKRGVAVFQRFPNNKIDRLLAQTSLREHGYFLAQGDTYLTSVATSDVFRKFEQKRLFDATCIKTEAAATAFATQEVTTEGHDTDDDESAPSAATPISSRTGDDSETVSAKAKKRDVPRLPEPKQEDFGKEPTVQGVLLCIYAYLVTCENFEKIFQRFVNVNQFGAPDFKTGNGDGKRKQVKMIDLAEPAKEDGESDASFVRRRAGHQILGLILRELFYDVCDVLNDQEYGIEKFFDVTFAGPLESSSGTEVQDYHTDKEPDRLLEGTSTIWNISTWWHNVSILLNSAKNVRKLVLHYRKNKDDFVEAYKRVRSSAGKQQFSRRKCNRLSAEEIDRAWQCHLHHHVKDNAAEFLKMQCADLMLPPVMIMVFKLDFVHGGGAYPGRVPRHLRETVGTGQARRWVYRHGKFHFRSAALTSTDDAEHGMLIYFLIFVYPHEFPLYSRV
jgi:hypothetical protein